MLKQGDSNIVLIPCKEAESTIVTHDTIRVKSTPSKKRQKVLKK